MKLMRPDTPHDRSTPGLGTQSELIMCVGLLPQRRHPRLSVNARELPLQITSRRVVY